MPEVEEDRYLVGMKKGDKAEVLKYVDKLYDYLVDLSERRRQATQDAIDGDLRAAARLRTYFAANGQPLLSWVHKGRRLV